MLWPNRARFARLGKPVYAASSHRPQTIIPGTVTLAHRTGSQWPAAIWTHRKIAGATYFAEAQYVTPHEYSWCQSHPGQCNMFNNASYRQFSCERQPDNFTFSPVGSTARTQPAIMAWTGATVNQVEPDPGNDGIWFMGYKVTNPSSGVWHYEYALYNENLDRAIQSFSVPLGPGTNISNIGFHAPPQEPGWANDGTFNNQGYSSTPWTVTQASGSITWNSETFAQNQNANAIRYGTLYNFRFDAEPATAKCERNSRLL